uniref:Uncharacterized protein LOC102809475 n=1 Tax=Saccoglossus kowalevskii TaxID=10224 RepID=A0ABM0M308_SACKO|nr:PREDICTED: uncharacterized protein LOC102809475 [Saccoglossus kowalevskii]
MPSVTFTKVYKDAIATLVTKELGKCVKISTNARTVPTIAPPMQTVQIPLVVSPVNASMVSEVTATSAMTSTSAWTVYITVTTMQIVSTPKAVLVVYVTLVIAALGHRAKTLMSVPKARLAVILSVQNVKTQLVPSYVSVMKGMHSSTSSDAQM